MIGALAAAVVFLAARARGRRPIDGRSGAPREGAGRGGRPNRLPGGLFIGAPEPSFDLETLEGGRFRSVALNGALSRDRRRCTP